MQNYPTRSARHQKRKVKTPILNPKTIVPLIGTGLMVASFSTPLFVQEAAANTSTYQAPSASAIDSFIEQIGWTASEVAASNDLYASVMIAQALLESGYGTSGLSNAPYYNLFGVKGSYDTGVYMSTQEYLNGQWVTMSEPFRQYNSFYESLQDHANVLRSTSFTTGAYHYSGAWLSQTTSYLDATAYLTGRYATDPGYAGKLNWLISTYNLTRFDSQYSGYQTTATSYSDSSYDQTGGTGIATATQSYTVQSGDTLWDIANTFGTTVDAISANNGLSGYTIMIGQQLIV
ncbi:N-acetylmuramoyl-L-alanine amidase [Enterococcus sp. JM4C]|uniref:glucosaminidase domain-containing protein n=1 Tax=Candidatus Enterococcus huntleyi TaxID=1857217 RepID=UPI00137AED00|nr:glucosaminidase domain-containing protein [Enterococcus sp. JM4C]KAF1296025.1 N-acetylmuramoyl-L-alanine amidase [Enterococcus sp. JM4C]